MRTNRLRIGPAGAAAVLVLSAVTGSVHAATVFVNAPQFAGPQFVASVAGAKYRLDGTNWDMALHSGTGTNSSLPAQADFVQANLGNLTALNNAAFRFEVTHQAGVGFTYSLTNLSSSTTTTLSWGAGLPGTNAATLQRTSGGVLDGIEHAPTDPFNFLLIEARAQRNDAGNGVEPDSSLTFSNLSFSGTGLTNSGSFTGGTTNENTAGSAWTPPGTAVENGRYWQFLYSDVDLSQYDWTFTADVTGFAATNAGQELLRFEVTAKNVAPVPLPAAAWLLLSGLLGLGAAGRRSRTTGRAA